MLPLLGILFWLYPGSTFSKAVLLSLAVLAAPLPAVLHARRQRARLLACAAKAEEEAAQLKAAIGNGRYRTSRLREELQAADRQARLSTNSRCWASSRPDSCTSSTIRWRLWRDGIEVLLDERKEDAALCADLEQMLKETRYMGNIAEHAAAGAAPRARRRGL